MNDVMINEPLTMEELNLSLSTQGVEPEVIYERLEKLGVKLIGSRRFITLRETYEILDSIEVNKQHLKKELERSRGITRF